MKKGSLLVCVLMLAFAITSVQAEQYCVVFEKAARKAVKEQIQANFGDVIKKELKIVDVFAVSLSTEDAIKAATIPGVQKVVPDQVKIKWDKRPPAPVVVQRVPWGVDRIDADKAWLAGNTGEGVKVAVVDTGIDSDHSDLMNNLKGGINAADETLPPEDTYGHGTMVAGVIAAVDNTEGVIGIGPKIELYAVKIHGGGMSAIYRGIEWCAYGTDGAPNTGDEPNIQVINMSFGIEDGAGNSVDDPLFHEALIKAYNTGIVLVASAGNDGRDIGITPQYPACYAEVIAVSATGIQITNGKPSERKQVDYFASWSNYGAKIDLAAPGVSVETTAMGGGYSGFSGTSASSPHVVGTAALVLKAFPTLTPEEVRTYLKNTAELLANLTSAQQGAGLVDAGFAIASQRAPRNPKLSLLSATWGQIKDQ